MPTPVALESEIGNRPCEYCPHEERLHAHPDRYKIKNSPNLIPGTCFFCVDGHVFVAKAKGSSSAQA